MLGLGSQAQLGLGIAIVLQDQFSSTSRKMVSSMNSMKQAGSSMIDQMARDYQSYQTKIAGVAAAATYGMFQMAKSGASLSHTINQTMIIAGDKLGQTREQLVALGTDIAREFGEMPQDVFGVMLENARQGVTEGLAILTRYQTAAAKILGEPLDVVAGGILQTLHTYNLPINENNIKNVTNALVAGANQSAASVSSLTESFHYAGFTLRSWGMDVNKATAFLAKMSQSGIEATSAGVALNQMLITLGNAVSWRATKAQTTALARMGISKEELGGLLQNKDLFGAVALIEKAATREQDLIERNTDIQALLGVRGARAGQGGFGSVVPGQDLEGMLRGIERGQANNMTITQGIASASDAFSDIIRTQAEWETFKMKFVEVISPELNMLAKGLKWLNDNFISPLMSSNIGSVFVQLAAGGIVIVGLMAGLKAAIIAATFAFEGWGKSGMMGGFGGILKGRLGNLGNRLFAGSGAATAMGWTQNAAGQWVVGKGDTWTHPMTGKIYKGLQTLPKGAAPAGVAAMAGRTGGLGGWLGLGARTGGVVASGANLAGKAVPLIETASLGITGILGVALEFLPMIGALVGVSTLIADLLSDHPTQFQAEVLNAQQEFAKQMNLALWGVAQPGQSVTAQAMKPWAGGNKDLVVNLNLNGVPQQTQTIPIDDPNKPFHTIDMQYFH